MKRELARRLESVSDFADPSADLEQYRTPTELAATIVHLASLNEDLAGRTVVDLGSGTGMLALGAAYASPDRVVGVELDCGAIRQARANEREMDPPTAVGWVRGDATRPPLSVDDATVLMNPPFGAQDEHRHADRQFLSAAVSIAAVTYSIHNEGSRSFVESFAEDNGGDVTHSYEAAFDIPRQFSFHRDATRTVQTEVYRIEWDASRTE